MRDSFWCADSICKVSRRKIGVMFFLILLLNADLIFAGTSNHASQINWINSSSLSAIYSNISNRRTIKPYHYNISLTTHIIDKNDDFTFHGDVNILIEIIHPTQTITLNSYQIRVEDKIRLKKNLENTFYIPQNYKYFNRTYILDIYFDDYILPGFYTLYLDFSGFITETTIGFVAAKYIILGNVNWAFATLIDSTNEKARMLPFPCWDDPDIRSSFELKIKHPEDYTALSNAPIKKREWHEEENMMLTIFEEIKAMPAHLISIAMLPFFYFETTLIINETVNIWYQPQMREKMDFAHIVAIKVAKYMKEYTYDIFKIPKMDHIAMPMNMNSILPNWGILFYSEMMLTCDKQEHLFRKSDVTKTIAHKVVYQWFGDMFTSAMFPDMLLNEALTSFLQVYIRNKIFPELRVMDLFVVQVQQISLFQETNPIDVESKDTDVVHVLLPERPVLRETSIIRMFQHMISEDSFRDGISVHLQMRTGVMTLSDLWWAMQFALNVKKKVLSHYYRLEEMMENWILQEQYPVVNVERNYTARTVIIKQEHVLGQEGNINNTKWWVPVTFTTQSKLDFNETAPNFWMKPQDPYVELKRIDEYDWIIINVQQTGYYRVNYDSANWEKLACFLNSKKYEKIHVLNRAQIIDDAYYFLSKGQLSLRIFLHLTDYLRQERDHIPWYPMKRVFSYISKFRGYPESNLIKTHMIDIMKDVLDEIGYIEKPDDTISTKLNRLLITKWACHFDYSGCLIQATIMLNDHLDNPKKILPWWEDWLYCTGVKSANMEVWNKILKKYNESHERILKYITCNSYPEISVDFLSKIVIAKHAKKHESLMNIYHVIVDYYMESDALFYYVLANLHYLEGYDRVETAFSEFPSIIKSIYLEIQADQIINILRRKFVPNGRTVETLEDQVLARVKEMRKDLAEFVDRFTFEDKRSIYTPVKLTKISYNIESRTLDKRVEICYKAYGCFSILY